MNILDRAIDFFAPMWAANRQRARIQSRFYESYNLTRLRDYQRDDRSANINVSEAQKDYRGIARQLEQNYDWASAGLDVLIAKIIGQDGISIEPQPMLNDGTIDIAFAHQIDRMLREWARHPEVTMQRDWPGEQRMLGRSMYRDGEVFTEIITGSVASVHGTRIPLSLQSFESNYVPLNYHDPSRNIYQGIELTPRGRPRAYHLYRNYPDGDINWIPQPRELRRVPADRMIHLKDTKRLHQLRGMSRFAPSISRFGDIKNYEESERAKMRLAACIGAKVTIDPADYTPEELEDLKSGRNPLNMSPGMVFYGTADEDIQVIESKQDSQVMVTYLDNMLRGAAKGIGAGPASVTANYEGSYSARRQENVDQDQLYGVDASYFISTLVNRVYRKLVRVSLTAGIITPSANADSSTLFDAIYQKPAMVSVDPTKDIDAAVKSLDAGIASRAEVIRKRGGNPYQVNAQIARENEMQETMQDTAEQPESDTNLRIIAND